jgi:hypothetical protein
MMEPEDAIDVIVPSISSRNARKAPREGLSSKAVIMMDAKVKLGQGQSERV